MFLRSDHGLNEGAGANALSFGRALAPTRPLTPFERLQERFPDFDIAPDLGANIGSREWFRGTLTCAALCAATVMLMPKIGAPIYGLSPAPLRGEAWKDARKQAIAPLALGAVTGDHAAPTALVSPLSSTPERPIIETTATLGRGETFDDALRRAGVSRNDAASAVNLLGGAIDLTDMASGTRLDVTLGRRPAPGQSRPLEKLAFRARFDLALEVVGGTGDLTLKRIPISIDHTPLRIRGRVGSSLYRSARAAGAPARAVEAYIKAIASRISMSNIDAGDRFDFIIERARAATGEVKLGGLMLAGLDRDGKDIRLLKWAGSGKQSWYDSTGTGEKSGRMILPVQGRITSTFGWRVHPILHTRRMHKGLDIAGAYGAPIRAAMSGVVAFAGRNGGYGNFVKLNNGGGLATGYGHMSRIAVRAGTRVSQGQVIGYEGSTGLSTGAHVHFEVTKNGRAVDPLSISVARTQRLGGSDLRKFKSELARLLTVPVTTPQDGSDPD